MKVAADALDQKAVEAFNKRDAKAVMELRYKSPNYNVLDERELVVGWETFNKGVEPWLATFKEFKFAYTDSRNIVEGDLVFGQHKWTSEETKLDGTKRVVTGIHSDVKAVRDGKWVILSESFAQVMPKPDPVEMVKIANALDKKGPELYNSNDSDGFLANYWKSPELVVIDGNASLIGWEAWRAEIKTQIQNKKPGSIFEYTESHNLPVGEFILGYGRWRGGAPGSQHDGLYTNLRALRDGKWVTIMDHYSILPQAKPVDAKKK
jgi:ketosteroid isomerase-like protein